jgi:hypothetical protein
MPDAARPHTTVTERTQFRTCRRQWYLETVEHLEAKDKVQWNLIFGTVIHAALETYYRGLKRNLKTTLSRYKKEWGKQYAILHETYGSLFTYGIEEEWIAYYEKGKTMLTYYDLYDKATPWEWGRIVEVTAEKRRFVEIPGTDCLLSAQIDLVVERDDQDIWIWDHKTASSAYNARALDIDDQLTGNCWVYWRDTGTRPRGAIYNALIKEPPRPPKELKGGKLSKDKAQRTTYDLYIQAIQERGQLTSDYEDILAYLYDKKWDQFFVRDGLEFNEEQLLSFEGRLKHEVEDIERCIDYPEYAYPNPTQWTCGNCSVLPLCQTMEERGDVEYIRERMYQVGEPRVIVPKGV